METVIETPAYLAAAADAGMTEAERESAILTVSANPLAGEVIVGAGGCRKVRLAGKGNGKSGGYRLITFYRSKNGVFLLTVFSKGDRANLTKAERNDLKSLTYRL
ncbi:MAG: type II toxin-antitoxin system RelE/ParE family toxin [Pseudomonadota bacterium]